MLELKGDLWEYHSKGHWVVITVNGDTKKDGACVMGRGVAKQAADKFPDLPYRLGNTLKVGGNNVHIFDDLKIITFPVKHGWREQADLKLIEKSLQQLITWANTPSRKHGKFYIVRAGAGNGRLSWKTVKPLFERYFALDDRFVVIDNGE